jgi:hypothetical protein
MGASNKTRTLQSLCKALQSPELQPDSPVSRILRLIRSFREHCAPTQPKREGSALQTFAKILERRVNLLQILPQGNCLTWPRSRPVSGQSVRNAQIWVIARECPLVVGVCSATGRHRALMSTLSCPKVTRHHGKFTDIAARYDVVRRVMDFRLDRPAERIYALTMSK